MAQNDFNPYVGPRPFEHDEEDARRFFGRSQETQEIVSFIFGHPVALVYAQSGAGKTSLFNASISINLEQKGFDVLPLTRVGGGVPENVALNKIKNIYIFNALLKMDPKTDPRKYLTTSLTEFLKLRSEMLGDDARPRAIIFDQFEELFTFTPEDWREQRKGFFLQVVEALADDPLLRVVFVIREDFLAELDPYARDLPERMRIRYRLERLGEQAALKAIKDPLAKTNRSFAPGVAEGLVKELLKTRSVDATGAMIDVEGQYVEPVQLQVVCVTLWSSLESDVTEIQQPHLKDFDVSHALSDFYESAIESAAKETGVREAKIRNWFGNILITPMKTRSNAFRGGKSTGNLDNNVVDFLESRHIIRAEFRAGARWYELTHDRLVEPILDSNVAWLEALSPLQRQAALWNDQNRSESWLSADQALIEHEQWAKDHPDEMTKIEEEFLEACRKYQTQVNERQEMQRRELEMAQNLAKQQEQLAKEQRKSAEQALVIAREQERRAKEQEEFAQEQARSAQKAKRFNVIVGSLAIIVIVLLGFAISSYSSANKSRSIAETKEAEANEAEAKANEAKAKAVEEKEFAEKLANDALAGELASAAEANLNNHLDLSILLSLEAFETKADNSEAQSALFNGMQRAQRLIGFLATAEQPAEEIRYSPNGEYIAVLREDGIVVWDIGGNEPVIINGGKPVDGSEALAGSTDSSSRFIFNPDSTQLIFLTRSGLNFWDLQEPKMSTGEAPVNGHTGSITQIVFNADTNTFATKGENGEVSLWNASENNLPDQSNSALFGEGDTVSFSPDGRKFAVLDTRLGTIVVGDIDWQAEKSKANQEEPDTVTIQKEPNTVTSIAFDQNGEILAMGLKDGNITKLHWADDSDQGTTYKTGQESPVIYLSFSLTGDLLTWTSASGITKILDLNNPSGEGTKVEGTRLSVSPDGNTVVYSAYDYSANDYQIKLRNVINGNDSLVPVDGEMFVFSPDGGTIAVTNESANTITLLEMLENAANPLGDPLQRQADDPPINSLAFSQDGKFLAVGTIEGSVELWDVNNREPIYSGTSREGKITAVTFSPDGSMLIVGRADGTFDSFKVISRGLQLVSPGIETHYQGRITKFEYSPDEQFLYSIANDGVLILDGTTPRENAIRGNIKEYIWAEEKVSALLIADGDKIGLWDVRGGQRGDTIPGVFSQLVTSDKQQTLVVRQESGSELDKKTEFTLWDTLSGEQILGPYLTDFISFSPDGNTFAVKSQQEEAGAIINLYDILTGDRVGDPIQGDDVIFSPDVPIAAIYDSRNSRFTLLNLQEKTHLDQYIDGYPVFAPNHSLVATEKENQITFWDTSNGELKKTDEPIKGDSVSFSPSGNYFAVSSSNPPQITLGNTANLEQIRASIPGRIFSDSHSNQTLFGIGPDEDIVVISNFGGITLWSITTGDFIGDPIPGVDIAYLSQEENYLVVRQYYGPTKVFDLQTSEQKRSPDVGTLNSFSPDEKWMLLDSENGNLLWNVESGVQVGPLIQTQSGQSVYIWDFDQIYTRNLNSLIFTPNNYEKFAILDADGSVTLWETDAPPSIPGTVKNFGEPATSVIASALSPDGRTLVLSTPEKLELYQVAGEDSFILVKTFDNRHIRQVDSVALSPDGRTVLSYNRTDMALSLLDAVTGAPVGETINNSAETFVFSPDGKVMVSDSPAFSDGNMYMYTLRDMSGATPIGTPIGEGVPLFGNNLQFSQDGQFAAIQDGSSGLVTIVRLETGELVGTYAAKYFYGFTSDSAALILGDSTSVFLSDIENGKKLKDVSNVNGRDRLFFSDDLTLLAIVTNSGSIEIRDTESGNKVLTIVPDANLGYTYVYDSRFSPDKTIVALRDYWGRYTLYHIDIEKKEAKKIGDEESSILSSDLRISPDGKYAVSSSNYQSGLTLWDMSDGSNRGNNTIVSFQGFGLDGNVVVALNSNDNSVEFWNMPEFPDINKTVYKYPGRLRGVKISSDGKTVAVYGNEGISLLELPYDESQKDSDLISENSAAPQKLVFSPNGKTLATVGTDGILLWSVKGQELEASDKILMGQTGQISEVRFTENSDFIVYTDSDGGVYRYALSELDDLGTEAPKKTGVCPGSLSPYGKYVVIPSGDKLQVWEVAIIPRQAEEFDRKNASCSGSMAFSRSEKSFAYSDPYNYRIYTYVLNDGGTPFAAHAELIGNPEDAPPYRDLAFLYEENLLISRAGRGRIFMWDIDNRTQVVASDQPGEPILFADGRMLIYLRSENRFVEIDVAPEKLADTLSGWAKLLCEKVTRPLSTAELSQYFREGADVHQQACDQLLVK